MQKKFREYRLPDNPPLVVGTFSWKFLQIREAFALFLLFLYLFLNWKTKKQNLKKKARFSVFQIYPTQDPALKYWE